MRKWGFRIALSVLLFPLAGVDGTAKKLETDELIALHRKAIGEKPVRKNRVAQGQGTLDIRVGGHPAEATDDAPDYVDSLSQTVITVSVVDDEDVPIGAQPVTVVQVEGSGAVTKEAPENTSDGKASFTYQAPLTGGQAVFLVRVGPAGAQIAHTITINIGSAPEEAPEAPPATWSAPLASGTWNLVWNGEDGADPSAGAGEGVTAIWQWNGSGWDGYFPSAADVPGGNTLTSLTNGAAYWVVVE